LIRKLLSTKEEKSMPEVRRKKGKRKKDRKGLKSNRGRAHMRWRMRKDSVKKNRETKGRVNEEKNEGAGGIS